MQIPVIPLGLTAFILLLSQTACRSRGAND